MEQIKLSIDVDIGYASIPVPSKIIIPVKPGKVAFWRYKQHQTDPLRLHRIKIEYSANGRIKIRVRGTGRLSIKNFPDLRIGGTKVEIEAGLKVQEMILMVNKPRLTKLDLPNVPGPLDDLLRGFVNDSLMNDLTKALELDLRKPLDEAKTQINQPNVFNIDVGKKKVGYIFTAGVQTFKPQVEILPDKIHIGVDIELAPRIDPKS